MGSDGENVETKATEEALDPRTFLVPRLEGLMDILEKLEIPSRLMLSEGVFPYLEADSSDGSELFFSYLPHDVMGGQFILEISKSVDTEGADPDMVLFDVNTFNMGSEFAFAVIDPSNGDVVLRAQVPELGGISLEWYSFLLELFETAYEELKETLLTED